MLKVLKRCAAVLAAIAMLAGTAAVPQGALPDVQLTACAETLTSGDYEYEVTDDGTVTFTKYTGEDTEVVIPSELDGKKVTGIGSSAFSYYTTLTSVTIPDSVTSIGKNAFYHCTALTAVTIPEGVTNIEDYAFYWTGLTSVTIPEGVTSIGNSAFSDCAALTSAAIPEGVTSIGKGAFSNCTALTSVTIPESVTSVDGFAFYGTALTSVTIPGSVTSVGGGAFGGCQRLTNVTVLNPDCSIDDNIRTFFNTLDPDNDTYSYSGTITGYEGSTAQAYAEKYGYTFVSLGKAQTLPLGDLDGNDNIDSIDAAAILTASALEGAGLDSGLTSAQQQAADVDKSGHFDSVDAAYILQYSAYLGAGLGSETLEEYMAKQ